MQKRDHIFLGLREPLGLAPKVPALALSARGVTRCLPRVPGHAVLWGQRGGGCPVPTVPQNLRVQQGQHSGNPLWRARGARSISGWLGSSQGPLWARGCRVQVGLGGLLGVLSSVLG